MAEYIYTREIDITGKYNIDNTLYVDGAGDMIGLCRYLVTVFPTIKFNMNCAGSQVILDSDIPLDGSQQATLTSEIAIYKAQPGE